MAWSPPLRRAARVYLFLPASHLGFYSAGHMKIMAERVDEIGRRIGGWIKSTS
ncbi:MAG: hypothetical protein AAFQ92_01790 [Bacteroidota bacterium]